MTPNLKHKQLKILANKITIAGNNNFHGLLSPSEIIWLYKKGAKFGNWTILNASASMRAGYTRYSYVYFNFKRFDKVLGKYLNKIE